VPGHPNGDGHFTDGMSKEFAPSQYGLIDKNGIKGISDSNVHEHVFL
jgi:hypothetical protein